MCKVVGSSSVRTILPVPEYLSCMHTWNLLSIYYWQFEGILVSSDTNHNHCPCHAHVRAGSKRLINYKNIYSRSTFTTWHYSHFFFSIFFFFISSSAAFIRLAFAVFLGWNWFNGWFALLLFGRAIFYHFIIEQFICHLQCAVSITLCL